MSSKYSKAYKKYRRNEIITTTLVIIGLIILLYFIILNTIEQSHAIPETDATSENGTTYITTIKN